MYTSFFFFFFFKKCLFSTKWFLQIKVVLLKWFWTLIYNSAAYCLKEGGLEGSSQSKTTMAFIKSITRCKKPCAPEGLTFLNGKPSSLQSCALMYLVFELLSPDNDHGGGLSQHSLPCSCLVMST